MVGTPQSCRLNRLISQRFSFFGTAKASSRRPCLGEFCFSSLFLLAVRVSFFLALLRFVLRALFSFDLFCWLCLFAWLGLHRIGKRHIFLEGLTWQLPYFLCGDAKL